MDDTRHDTHDAQEPQMRNTEVGSAPPGRPSEAVVDNSKRDAQEQQPTDSDSRTAPPDRPDKGVGATQGQDPLIELLRLMHKEQGKNKTAAKLGVDRKTIWRALEAGRLTPRLRDALERERQATELAAEREAAGGDRLELRVEGLERRLQDVEEQLAGGLGRLGEELAGVRDEVKTLAWTRPGGAPSGDASTLPSPHRTYPQVVTVEALPDDGDVFGEALPQIVEWRNQKARFKAHWPSVEGLEAEVRMLELELELIEERRLTLPPGRLPWEWDQRRREARRRAQQLGTARTNLRRARWRRRVSRVVTCALLAR